VFTYSDFTVVPSMCPLTVSCTTISGPSSGVLLCSSYAMNSSTKEITFNFDETVYKAAALTPGTYTLTYTVAAAAPTISSTFSFDLVLTDPCKSTTTTAPTMTA